MPDCPNCPTHLVRTHRSWFQSIVYSHVFQCPHCGTRVTWVHSRFLLNAAAFLSRRTRCLRCGAPRVNRISKGDRSGSVSNSVFSRVQAALGAPLNECTVCGLLYHDWRPLSRGD